MSEDRKFKSLSKSQLAMAYNNISIKTLNSWLLPFQEQIGAYKGKMYNPKQIKIIFELLGEPENL